MPLTRISFELDDEQFAMLDAIRGGKTISRAQMARELLVSLLEDDAAEHGACSNPRADNIVVFRGRA